MRRGFRLCRIAALLGLLLTTAGCGDRSFNGKDISHLMPRLEFELIDETGQPVTEAVFSGRPVALYFGFSHCPDICPMTLAKLAAAARKLPEDQRRQLQLAFVSVDPARDGPAELARYTDAFSDAMLGLTGSQAQLQALTRRYRVTYGYEEPDASGDYAVSHSSAIWVFGADFEPELMLFDDMSIDHMAADLARVVGQ